MTARELAHDAGIDAQVMPGQHSALCDRVTGVIERALEAERERCANECERWVTELGPGWDRETMMAYGARNNALRASASRIRALGGRTPTREP